jgi:hypothetical protein
VSQLTTVFWEPKPAFWLWRSAHTSSPHYLERRESEARLASSNTMLERERSNKLMNLEAMAASRRHSGPAQLVLRAGLSGGTATIHCPGVTIRCMARRIRARLYAPQSISPFRLERWCVDEVGRSPAPL